MRDLPKKKLDVLSKALESAQATFRDSVEKLAEKARAEILPYFKEHNLSYMAGNGIWYISSPTGDVDNDELPAHIRALLYLEVVHADHLGYYIRDIKRGKW